MVISDFYLFIYFTLLVQGFFKDENINQYNYKTYTFYIFLYCIIFKRLSQLFCFFKSCKLALFLCACGVCFDL